MPSSTRGWCWSRTTAPGASPIWYDPALLPPQRLAWFTIGLNVFGFVAVAALSGYLAEGLRRADEQLAVASNQIADLQAFSQHVIDSLTSGLATSDIDGRLLTFNRAATAITGVKAAEAVGQPASAVLQLPPDFGDLFGAREDRPPLPRVDFGFNRPDGRQVVVGLSTAPLITPRGETGFLFTFQDVTDARKHEREARVQQRLAAVGEMAAGIAHEIRNPLASMSGSIQILRQELPLTVDQSQLMDIVLRESDRLNDTIRSFLAYARPQRLATTRVDVRQVITDTARLLENNAELSDAHEIAVDVPAAEAVVRRGREPDPADRLEPGDERGSRHARRRRAAALCVKQRDGRGGRAGRAGHPRRGPGRRHRAGRNRRHLPAVPRRRSPAAPGSASRSSIASSATTAARCTSRRSAASVPRWRSRCRARPSARPVLS